MRARTVIISTGVSWRRLAIEGFDRFIGKGIYYGAARSEATTHNLDVYLIGAGNSAGQAALYFANHARKVTLVVRGDSLAKSMSYYLIEQIRGKSNIAVQLQSQVHAAYGDTHLTAIDIYDKESVALCIDATAVDYSCSLELTPIPGGYQRKLLAMHSDMC